MWYNKWYWVPRPTTKEQQLHMTNRKKENIERCKGLASETWFYNKLKELKKQTWINFNRQAVRGTRVFDFWCSDLWIAVEVDWWYHMNRKTRDFLLDRHCKEVSEVIVYRVGNYDEKKATDVIDKIKKSQKRFIRKFIRWLTMSDWLLEKAKSLFTENEIIEYKKRNITVKKILKEKRTWKKSIIKKTPKAKPPKKNKETIVRKKWDLDGFTKKNWLRWYKKQFSYLNNIPE